MKDLHTLSHRYYEAFYSYRAHIGLVSIYTLAVALSFACFSAGVVCMLFYKQELAAHFSEKEISSFAFGSEIVFIVVWLAVNFLKDQRAKRKVGTAMGRNFRDLSDAKRAWLEAIVDVPRTEYFSLAKELSDSLDLKEKHRSTLGPSLQSLARSIYDPDSKARVVSFMIFALSVSALVLLRAYETSAVPVDFIFEIYQKPSDVLLLIMIVAVLFWFLMIAIVFSKDFILAVLSSLSLWVEGKQSQSRTNANRLIEALLDSAAIPRKKLRIGEKSD
ncbi:hypothetical protein [Spongiibacter tropicus]|uniref:hypothetical protein n=1 Tax=Spongiibacter tropicus TaxID=454602 RepID=UPI0003B37580|nr:hypothetical protein [Spongiibacter tropicus]